MTSAAIVIELLRRGPIEAPSDDPSPRHSSPRHSLRRTSAVVYSRNRPA